VYAFFGMLATQTADAVWTTRAQWARTFVVSMWHAGTHMFWTGTGTDGKTTNTDFVPEDTQTWSYLALGDPQYGASIDYAISKLTATDGAFTGTSFSSSDRSKVWFEGTAHLTPRCDCATPAATSPRPPATRRPSQTTAPNNDGKGIVAASHDGLKTGDGDEYYASLHTGATSWYLLALQGWDPFVLAGSSPRR
jgi:hypothetical protein